MPFDGSPSAARSWESVVYTRAVAPSSWTLPSHASLFTGKLVSAHGARFDEEGPLLLTQAVGGQGEIGEIRARPIADDETALAERPRAAGWQTAGFVGAPG